MPKKKKTIICIPRKHNLKKYVSNEPEETEPGETISILDSMQHLDTELQVEECLGSDTIIQTDVPSIGKNVQTENFIKNDHDYCA